jgi:hypothetical protein
MVLDTAGVSEGVCYVVWDSMAAIQACAEAGIDHTSAIGDAATWIARHVHPPALIESGDDARILLACLQMLDCAVRSGLWLLISDEDKAVWLQILRAPLEADLFPLHKAISLRAIADCPHVNEVVLQHNLEPLLHSLASTCGGVVLDAIALVVSCAHACPLDWGPVCLAILQNPVCGPPAIGYISNLLQHAFADPAHADIRDMILAAARLALSHPSTDPVVAAHLAQLFTPVQHTAAPLA